MLAFGPDGMQLMTLDEAKTLDEETAGELIKTMTTTHSSNLKRLYKPGVHRRA